MTILGLYLETDWLVLGGAGIIAALLLAYCLRPLAKELVFYGVALGLAVAALGLYLWLGRPDLPPSYAARQPEMQQSYRRMVLQEFTLMQTLAENPSDADAMIRLAALRLAEGRPLPETQRLLEEAARLTPKDPRLRGLQAVTARLAREGTGNPPAKDIQ